jgi:hypothetical protein
MKRLLSIVLLLMLVSVTFGQTQEEGIRVIPGSESIWLRILRSPELLLALSIAVITPLVGWLLRRWGIAHQARQVAYLSRRLELINKLKEFQNQHYGTDPSVHDWSILDNQITGILQSLKKHSITPTSTRTINYDGMYPLRRILLLYKPISIKGWVFHILFYIYLFLFFMSSFLSLLTLIVSIGLGGETLLINTIIFLINLFLFLPPTYAFHSAAAAEAKQSNLDAEHTHMQTLHDTVE